MTRVLLLIGSLALSGDDVDDAGEPGVKAHLAVRGVYGGIPESLLSDGTTLGDHGINAVWIGSTQLNARDVERLQAQGALVFAEFNTMHHAAYLEQHPDAAPVGPDGRVSPAPEGWQGVCPTHPGYRRDRLDAFRTALADYEIDGIWLDYHHAHANWERADPILPDTCFCARCLETFAKETSIDLPAEPVAALSARLLGPLRERWVQWRCDVFTGWVRDFAAIRDAVRPNALLGTFHCPWSAADRDGALRDKLAIDLRAQSAVLDVFSPMPYHARFGHADDPSWISRQVAWLGEELGLRGEPGERPRIWPIVQLSDWGETVPAGQVAEVLDHGTRPPATGVMVFAWGSLRQQPDKVERMTRFYRAITP